MKEVSSVPEHLKANVTKRVHVYNQFVNLVNLVVPEVIQEINRVVKHGDTIVKVNGDLFAKVYDAICRGVNRIEGNFEFSITPRICDGFTVTLHVKRRYYPMFEDDVTVAFLRPDNRTLDKTITFEPYTPLDQYTVLTTLEQVYEVVTTACKKHDGLVRFVNYFVLEAFPTFEGVCRRITITQ